MGATMGVITMKKTMMFAILAGGALALAACSGETAKAPEEEAMVEEAPEADAMAEETPEAASEEGAADADLDPTGNPIRISE